MYPGNICDPNWEKSAREIFQAQGLMAYLGIELQALRPGYAMLVAPYRPELSQQAGFFHGGVMATLVDNSGGIASGTLKAADQDVLAAEFKINLLRPGIGERLVAEAQVVRPGRTLTVARMEVFAETDGKRTLCAIGQGTYAYVDRA